MYPQSLAYFWVSHTARAADSVGSAVGYLIRGRTSKESWFGSQQDQEICFYPKNAQLACGAALSS